MYWRCDICDEVMYEKFRNNHPKSGFHKRLASAIIRKYVIPKPKPNKLDNTIRKSSRLHYRKYEKFLVIYSVKLLMSSNQIKNIRRQFPLPRNQLCINDPFFSKVKIIKEHFYSQILELRLTIVSRFKDMDFEYYLTKPKSVLEWRLCAVLDENPKIVCAFDYKRYNHPLHRDIKGMYIDYFL